MRWIGFLLIFLAVLLLVGLFTVRAEMAEIKRMNNELVGLRLDLESGLARMRVIQPRLERQLLEMVQIRATLDSAFVELSQGRRVLARTRGQLTALADLTSGPSPRMERALVDLEKVRGDLERLRGELEIIRTQMPR